MVNIASNVPVPDQQGDAGGVISICASIMTQLSWEPALHRKKEVDNYGGYFFAGNCAAFFNESAPAVWHP